MCYPGAVMTISYFTQLIGFYFFSGSCIGCFIILDRYLCGHSTDSMGTTLVTGLYDELCIGPHKRNRHRYL